MDKYFELLSWLGCRLGEHILGHYEAAKKCWLLRCWHQDFSYGIVQFFGRAFDSLWHFKRGAFDYDVPTVSVGFQRQKFRIVTPD